MIVGFYEVNGNYIAKEAGFKIGDKITEVNGKKVDEISDMTKNIKENINSIKVERNNKYIDISLNLLKDNTGVYKTGLYVKDKISGIGTLTYIDPGNDVFGALGHEIDESSTREKVEVKDGKIFYSNITGINKSSGGNPGEKNATFNSGIKFGNIKLNEESGIFGHYTKKYNKNDLIDIGTVNDIHEGKAYMYTVVEGNKVESFEININKINKNNKIKNILFEVTDKKLISKSNGIVSGMSGSPIVQDNKLVAAVTHVVVSDPIKGYGIFITNMLEEGDNS